MRVPSWKYSGSTGSTPIRTRPIRFGCRNGNTISRNCSPPGEFHTFDRMVTAIAAEKWGDSVVPLADGILGKEQLIYIRHLAPWSAFEPRNYPLVFATEWGAGRAVQSR